MKNRPIFLEVFSMDVVFYYLKRHVVFEVFLWSTPVFRWFSWSFARAFASHRPKVDDSSAAGPAAGLRGAFAAQSGISGRREHLRAAQRKPEFFLGF